MGRRSMMVVVICALVVFPVMRAAAQRAIPPEDRVAVEQRVEEMEAQFRRIRDEKIARCRGTWSACTNRKCKQIKMTDNTRWQVCQNVCDEEYERCKQVAYEYWPEGE